MKDQILKIAGVKSEKEFYKKYPTEESFMAKHGKALQKAAMGKTMVKNQLEQLTDFGNPKQAQYGTAFKPLSFDDAMTNTIAMNTGITKEKALANKNLSELQQSQQPASPQSNGLSNFLSMGQGIAEEFMAGDGQDASDEDKAASIADMPIHRNGGYVMIPKAQFGAIAGALKGIGQGSGGIGNLLTDAFGKKGDAAAITQAGKDVFSGGFGSGIKALGTKAGLGSFGKAAGLGVLNSASDIIGGIGQMKEQKNQIAKAQTAADVTGLVKQATTSNPVEMKKGNYARPEDNLIQPGQMGIPGGTGSNFLQMRRGGEIQNTYAPGTVYDNLEEIPTAEFGDYFQSSGQASIGKGIGSGIGSIFGPLGGQIGGMVGSLAGNLLGGAKDANKLASLNSQAQRNTMETASAQMTSGIRGSFGSFMEQGGWVSHDWQPQVITKFGEHRVSDLLKADPTMDTLRAGGHLKEYTPPSAEAMFTGKRDLPYQMEDGGYMAMGGNLQTHWGGDAEHMSYNPYIPGGGETVMFRGQSHDDTNGKGQSGIGITYGDNPVEVERGEPMTEMNNGGVVFGNMLMPGGKQKFKHYAADLSKTEAKQNKIMDKASKLALDADENDTFGRLTLNSSNASLIGANMKLKDIAQKKQDAADLQSAILDTAEEMGLVSDDLAKGKITKANFGGKFTAQNGSVIELLKKAGQKTDKSSRASLAESLGVVKKAKDYTGTAKQNLALYDAYSKKGSAPAQDQLTPVKIGPAPQLFPIEPDPIPVDEYGNLFDSSGNVVDQSGALPGVFNADQIAQGKGKGKFDWKTLGMATLAGISPLLRPTDQEGLDPSQLMGEYAALATNQLEPVQAQKFQPQLGGVMDISFQDQLNEITAQSRAAERMMQNNPEAAAALFAQVAQAKNKVLAEQTRANMASRKQTFDENRNLLNQGQQQNLQILDQQYARQAQAKSNTKAQAQAALNSIADKVAKNKLENRQLGVMENMYKYRFDPQGRAVSFNDPYQWDLSGKGSGSGKQTPPPGFKFVYNEDGTVADMKPIKAKNGTAAKTLNSSIVKATKLKNI